METEAAYMVWAKWWMFEQRVWGKPTRTGRREYETQESDAGGMSCIGGPSTEYLRIMTFQP